mmetsp:Transcript_298/g.326  ORF Transcript_298/g.326 Transcript_298/m.326 type:complete len:101 (+) Transcript_298:1-303(+)
MALVNESKNKINEGWDTINSNAIKKLQTYLNTGNSEVIFSKKEYMAYYTIIYNLCTMKQEEVQKFLYQKYSESINHYLQNSVLPHLQEQSTNGEALLKEL